MGLCLIRGKERERRILHDVRIFRMKGEENIRREIEVR